MEISATSNKKEIQICLLQRYQLLIKARSNSYVLKSQSLVGYNWKKNKFIRSTATLTTASSILNTSLESSVEVRGLFKEYREF